MGKLENDSEFLEAVEKDKSKRIGSAHGEGTDEVERSGYGRDIGQGGISAQGVDELRTSNSGLTRGTRAHPSKILEARKRGYGIGGGYERPYRKEKAQTGDNKAELYGPLPHAGYYGAGTAARPFKRGQAGFSDEIEWYKSQYGERTSEYEKK